MSYRLAVAAASTAGSFAWLWQRQRRQRAECCGIIGYIGPDDAEPILMGGIRLLQNRGYDSCGIATLSAAGDLVTTKFASRGTTSDCVDLLAAAAPANHATHHIGIAHTRWATHGGKTDLNAHPHMDWMKRVALVHNGSIDNFAELREELEGHGIPFATATDTEVIANLVGFYLEQQQQQHQNADDDAPTQVSSNADTPASREPQLPPVGEQSHLKNSMTDLRAAVVAATERLSGTWGLVVLQTGVMDELVCARHGSPLLVSATADGVIVGSEAAALAAHTNSYVPLVDGEVVSLRKGQAAAALSSPLRQIAIAVGKPPATSPDPYPHWTLREICEQPKSLARALNYGGRIQPAGLRVKLGGLDSRKEDMLRPQHLLLSGCGTSLYAGLYGQRLCQWLGCFEAVHCVDSSELSATTFPKSSTLVVLLSQSGETLDVIKACETAEQQGSVVLSVVNAVGSHLARRTNCGVYLNAGREVAVASTKAFTSQVLILSLVAAWFAQNRPGSNLERTRTLLDAVNRAPLQAGMLTATREQSQEIAAQLVAVEHLFVLGKGWAFPAALEGALKLKEITYVHAEGFTAAALKHGPFALLDAAAHTPVILLAPSDDTLPILHNAAQQVRARGALLIAIVEETRVFGDLVDYEIVVPPNGPLTALNMVIAMQMLAYELAVHKKINPDKPRGLAKTVTVL